MSTYREKPDETIARLAADVEHLQKQLRACHVEINALKDQRANLQKLLVDSMRQRHEDATAHAAEIAKLTKTNKNGIAE